ncbi:hypothetical protein FOA52_015799 [Chlamydomonas sp. UWO 241]|nr:hypothetical protein FOA52_015799 [Chlamydomonas sp. UWO 241]
MLELLAMMGIPKEEEDFSGALVEESAGQRGSKRAKRTAPAMGDSEDENLTVSHSTVEKRRRDRINQLVDLLAEQVPPSNTQKYGYGGSGTTHPRRPKHTVLSDTLLLLGRTREALVEYERQVAELKALVKQDPAANAAAKTITRADSSALRAPTSVLSDAATTGYAPPSAGTPRQATRAQQAQAQSGGGRAKRSVQPRRLPSGSASEGDTTMHNGSAPLTAASPQHGGSAAVDGPGATQRGWKGPSGSAALAALMTLSPSTSSVPTPRGVFEPLAAAAPAAAAAAAGVARAPDVHSRLPLLALPVDMQVPQQQQQHLRAHHSGTPLDLGLIPAAHHDTLMGMEGSHHGCNMLDAHAHHLHHHANVHTDSLNSSHGGLISLDASGSFQSAPTQAWAMSSHPRGPNGGEHAAAPLGLMDELYSTQQQHHHQQTRQQYTQQHHHCALYHSGSGSAGGGGGGASHSYGLVGGATFGSHHQLKQEPAGLQLGVGGYAHDSCPGQAAAHAVCMDWGLPGAGTGVADDTYNYAAWCADIIM